MGMGVLSLVSGMVMVDGWCLLACLDRRVGY